MATAVELAKKWDDSIFEMIADLERRIAVEQQPPYWLHGTPEAYEMDWYARKRAAVKPMVEQREAMLQALLKAASLFTDPRPYCELIGKRLDAARRAANVRGII
jgi:hypothetical protein